MKISPEDAQAVIRWLSIKKSFFFFFLINWKSDKLQSLCPLEGMHLVVSVPACLLLVSVYTQSTWFGDNVHFIVEHSKSLHHWIFILQPSLFLGGQVKPIQSNFKMNFVLCGTSVWMLAFIPRHFSRSLLCVQ